MLMEPAMRSVKAGLCQLFVPIPYGTFFKAYSSHLCEAMSELSNELRQIPVLTEPAEKCTSVPSQGASEDSNLALTGPAYGQPDRNHRRAQEDRLNVEQPLRRNCTIISLKSGPKMP